MYTLGIYNRALARLESDDGCQVATIELERTDGDRLVVRAYRNGPELFGIHLEDDGRFRVVTWDAAGIICGELYAGVTP